MPRQSQYKEFDKGTTHVDADMKVELAINDRAEAIVFHDKPFSRMLNWLEFNLDHNRLDFILDDGEVLNFGIRVQPELAKYMQNCYQVLIVLMDEEAGEAVEGDYVPLILHKS